MTKTKLTLNHLHAIDDGLSLLLPSRIVIDTVCDMPLVIEIDDDKPLYELGLSLGYLCGHGLIHTTIHSALRKITSRTVFGKCYVTFPDTSIAAWVGRRFEAEQQPVAPSPITRGPAWPPCNDDIRFSDE